MNSLYEFVFFLLLLFMIWRIRHINDDTLVKQECAMIVFSWLSVSTLSGLCFVVNQLYQCKHLQPPATYSGFFYASTAAVYWFILLRDLLTLSWICWFTRKVVNAELSFEQQDETIALMDFDMMLISVLPHKYFVTFLQEDQSQLLPYLQIIHIYKLYLNELETLQSLDKALGELSDLTSSFVTVSTQNNK